jgi:hypothetical protein
MSADPAQGGREFERWIWHDLRRTAVTKMHEIGIMPHVIEAVVNHISGHKGGIAGVRRARRVHGGAPEGA